MKEVSVLAVVTFLCSVQAQFNDNQCLNILGTCQLTSQACIGGRYVREMCGGPSNRRCCVPNSAILAVTFNDKKCKLKGGKCKYTFLPCNDGEYLPGLCGGPRNRRCCVNGGGSSPDKPCTQRGGTCQTSPTCVGGQYVPRLCGGPSSRQCCFKANAPCTSQQKQLACALLNNRNVRPATRHPSGVEDDAFARNNLQDMCSGGKASRSSYKCNEECFAPGGSTCLSVNLLRYLVTLAGSGIVQINELAGACHSCKSRHYSGLAVDLHKDPSRMTTYIEQCTQQGGFPIEESNHIHCQFSDAPHPNFQN